MTVAADAIRSERSAERALFVEKLRRVCYNFLEKVQTQNFYKTDCSKFLLAAQ